ncbi:MAG: hypothetical protein KIS77_21405 [Saprospiraceae bacterium]|nr:hypothetical protein [Saprospiraceae bacterium]
MRLYLLFFICLFIFWVSCGKNKDEDYRASFAGTYQCLKATYVAPANTFDTTLASLEVKLVGDSLVSLLGEEVKVDNLGTIGVDATGDCNLNSLPGYRIFCGNFHHDSLYLQTWVGVLGNFTQSHYYGKKQ